MVRTSRRGELARYGAAAAFLAAVTIAALLVRSGISGGENVSSTTRARTTPAGPIVPPSERRYYRVHLGDTLEGIAFKFRTTIVHVRRMNPGIDPNALQVGQRVRVK